MLSRLLDLIITADEDNEDDGLPEKRSKLEVNLGGKSEDDVKGGAGMPVNS